MKDRGPKTDFSQLSSLSYYAQTANVNRFLMIQYQGRNSQFLSNIAEQVNNDKYMEGLVNFYNYQLERAVEYDRSVAQVSAQESCGVVKE